MNQYEANLRFFKEGGKELMSDHIIVNNITWNFK